MNKQFNPVLMGTSVQGIGMRRPHVPRVIIGSELNGFVQGDLMDANAISLYISEKTKDLTVNPSIYEEVVQELQSLKNTNDDQDSRIADIRDAVDNMWDGESFREEIDQELEQLKEKDIIILQTILQLQQLTQVQGLFNSENDQLVIF